MPESTSIILIVKKNGGLVFVKSKDGPWKSPGGRLPVDCPSINDFIKQSLQPFFSNLIVESVEILASPQNELVLENERVRCKVLGCRIKGSVNPQKKKGNMDHSPKKSAGDFDRQQH